MRIEHIALYVNDIEGARQFFVKYFGATSNDGYHNLQTDFRSYFLSFEKGARLEIMNKPNMSDLPKEINRTGYAADQEQPEMAIMKVALLPLKTIKLKLRFN